MFRETCNLIRQSIYGIIGTSQIGKRVIADNGTAFLIAPDILVSAAHLTHPQSDVSKQNHKLFEVIRSPDIGQKTINVQLIVDDPIRDIALFKIDNPNKYPHIFLKYEKVPSGTQCGSLGFPLAEVIFTKQGKTFNLVERFQGSYISSFHEEQHLPSGRSLTFYETDSLMYGGSSGCPVFLQNSEVIGMQVASQIERKKVLKNKKSSDTRLAISLLVPSFEIISFAKKNGIVI